MPVSEVNRHSPVEIFFVFLKLGLTSFGGPIAHLGYFRREFVENRAWIGEHQFAQLLSISQFLPGPASSQLGFCIGLIRGGWLGALCAFLAFTLPSVALLIVFAAVSSFFSGPIGEAVIHGLKLVACAVVADALLGMSKNLCPDAKRRSIAVAAAALLLVFSSSTMQLVVILVGGILGASVLRGGVASDSAEPLQAPLSRRLGFLLLLLFLVLLIGLPLFASAAPSLLSVAEAFYRAGALVFGGGHVVLPLLEDSVVTQGWVSPDQFLAGYGASQAIPGPMFAFSAYLGALIPTGAGALLTAAVALVFMFLPGFLLVAGVLPFWSSVSHSPVAARVIAGVNAAVVGLLAAALYNPIFTSGIEDTQDLAIALVGFGLLAVWRLSPLIVVLWCVLASVLPVLI
ncbi:chromate ion family chromate transporter [Microbulbifer agarilyticus]|uniref:Chromate ion family chromate transporter n=1 Tax=Microbulbifer agarilyticus TaxID=260552 RepID=A0A1Q2M382_9GAMM|nr:chromate efflux transporter [Microbulbifer agarilyticus]AQQ67109.1 chromate ion family chromate transporter [Microbulbifer agarilyticus]